MYSRWAMNIIIAETNERKKSASRKSLKSTTDWRTSGSVILASYE